MEGLLDSGDRTNIDVGAGFAAFVGVSRACSFVSSIRLAFTAREVERGNLTLGCLGGSGSPTRNSSLPLGEIDRGDRVDVVVSEAIDVNRLSSCRKSRLGEIIRRFMIILRLLVLPSIGMTSGDGQENKDDKTPWRVCSGLIAKLLHSARKKHFQLVRVSISNQIWIHSILQIFDEKYGHLYYVTITNHDCCLGRAELFEDFRDFRKFLHFAGPGH